jgi:ammonia channel protein AmtB
VLWFGWYGHNAVSSMHLVDYAEVVAKTMVTTTIAAVLGGFSSVIFSTFSRGKNDEGEYHLCLDGLQRGIIAGLVGISASCSVVEPYGAAIIGLFCGGIHVGVAHLMNDWGIDDVLGAFPLHGACGMFGLIMPGLLTTPHNYGQAYAEGRANGCSGVLYGGDGSQLAANGLGLGIILLWVSLTSALGFGALKSCGVLRVPEQLEDESMDISDHGIILASKAPPSSIKDLVIPDDENNSPKPRHVKPRPSSSGRGGGGGSPRASVGGGKGGSPRASVGGGKGGRGRLPPPEGGRRTSKMVKNSIEMTSSV